MGSWRKDAPLCSPNCCPAARCRSRATAAAQRGRRSSLLQSGTYLFPKTASVSPDLKPSHRVPFQTLTAQLSKDLMSSCSPEADSLQQISLQTINADPFLKRSVTAGTCSPPPTSPSLLSRGTYSSVLNSNRYPLTVLIDKNLNLVFVLAA